MSSGIVGIGIQALNAAQAGIRTTQHNIANANTVGFHRQEVSYTNAQPVLRGGQLFGNGVEVAEVRRHYNQFLDQELQSSRSLLARHESYAAYAAHVDQLLGDADSGLGSAMTAFFSSVNEVANDPTSDAARQVMLSSGRNLTARIQGMDRVLREMQGNINREIESVASQINSYASRIATLGGRIGTLEATSGEQAHDLRDQRDQLVGELAKLVNVTTTTQNDGSFNVFLGSGQTLVAGNRVNAVSVLNDPTDPTLKAPALAMSGGNIYLDQNLLTGGQLAGMLSFRSEVLTPAQDDLDRLAFGLASLFNQGHRAGFDLNGSQGVDFFTNPAQRVGATAAVMEVNLVDDRLLSTRDDYTLTWDGANYTLTGQPSGTSHANATLAGLNATISGTLGFTLEISSGALTGADSWDIRFRDYAHNIAVGLTAPAQIAAASTAAGAPGDNANALNLAALNATPSLDGGGASFHAYYGRMISRTASLANEADVSQAAYESLTRHAEEAQQSVSGVNLDEEAANLIRYQQHYQAAARVIQIANSLFDEILAIAR